MKFLINFFDNLILKKIERGIFVIDKEAGRTSHDEVYFLRKKVSELSGKKSRVGHSGTLDPKVTGVLVLGCGKGTKVLEYILLSKKEYVAEFLFHKKVDRELFEKSIKKFLGKITQLPPVKSAVKREEREREVYGLKILNFSDDGRYARVFCSVQRGTYIRKLAHDMGEDMGVKTHMGDLCRTRAGVFSQKNSRIISMKNLEDIFYNFSECERCWVKKIFFFVNLSFYIYKIEELFLRLEKEKKMKKVFVNKKSVRYVLSGNQIRVKNLYKKSFYKNFKEKEVVSVFYKNKLNFWGSGRVLGVGEFLEDFDFDNIKKSKEREEEIIKLKKVF
jgi:tRNA U55 pseudouridine synthase TruB